MFAVDGVGHCKLVVVEVSNKRIKAASAHCCLQNYAAFRNIVGVYLHNAYMVAVDRRMEKVKLTAVEYKVASRLTVVNENGCFPLARIKVQYG